MKIQDTESIIDNFIRNLRFYWQAVFMISILAYGLTFLYRLNETPAMRVLENQSLWNWGSFLVAFILAISIFRLKRKYFRIRFFEEKAESLFHENPEMDEQGLSRKLTRVIGSKLKTIWILGSVLILVGVIYYWITFDAWNMHVYFIVGLYSLAINYPRRDLFTDIPYLVKEMFKEKPE